MLVATNSRRDPAMIEIATIKSAVELFEKALKYWVSHKEHQAKQYDEIFAPLFGKLEPIAQEYIKILNDARCSLQAEPRVALNDVLEAMIAKRLELVIARNSILGIADTYRAFTEYDFKPGVAHPKSIEEAVKNFMYAVRALFGSAGVLEGEQFETHFTPISSLTWEMRRSQVLVQEGKSELATEYLALGNSAQRYIVEIEQAWKTVASANHAMMVLAKR
jgi:hypothetical protein